MAYPNNSNITLKTWQWVVWGNIEWVTNWRSKAGKTIKYIKLWIQLL